MASPAYMAAMQANAKQDDENGGYRPTQWLGGAMPTSAPPPAPPSAPGYAAPYMGPTAAPTPNGPPNPVGGAPMGVNQQQAMQNPYTQAMMAQIGPQQGMPWSSPPSPPPNPMAPNPSSALSSPSATMSSPYAAAMMAQQKMQQPEEGGGSPMAPPPPAAPAFTPPQSSMPSPPPSAPPASSATQSPTGGAPAATGGSAGAMGSPPPTGLSPALQAEEDRIAQYTYDPVRGWLDPQGNPSQPLVQNQQQANAWGASNPGQGLGNTNIPQNTGMTPMGAGGAPMTGSQFAPGSSMSGYNWAPTQPTGGQVSNAYMAAMQKNMQQDQQQE